MYPFQPSMESVMTSWSFCTHFISAPALSFLRAREHSRYGFTAFSVASGSLAFTQLCSSLWSLPTSCRVPQRSWALGWHVTTSEMLLTFFYLFFIAAVRYSLCDLIMSQPPFHMTLNWNKLNIWCASFTNVWFIQLWEWLGRCHVHPLP